MIEINAANEYAVEVPGRGYVAETMPYFKISKEPVCMPLGTDVGQALEHVKERFIAMGCADIAETVRAIYRTVTVTLGEWELLTTEELNDQS